MIPNLKDITYENRLQQLKLTILETRRLKGDLGPTETIKIQHDTGRTLIRMIFVN